MTRNSLADCPCVTSTPRHRSQFVIRLDQFNAGVTIPHSSTDYNARDPMGNGRSHRQTVAATDFWPAFRHCSCRHRSSCDRSQHIIRRLNSILRRDETLRIRVARDIGTRRGFSSRRTACTSRATHFGKESNRAGDEISLGQIPAMRDSEAANRSKNDQFRASGEPFRSSARKAAETPTAPLSGGCR